MTPTPAATVRLSRLLHELKVDLAALDARATEIQGSMPTDNLPLSRTTTIVAAVNIHAWYTALETSFERVARLLDDTIPTGPVWHVELVSQMAVAVPGLRPALVDDSLQLDLEELRKFRHFFRNAYVLEFDEARVRELSQELLRIHPHLRSNFDRLCGHVARVIADLSGPVT